jgi:hypothetical protein
MSNVEQPTVEMLPPLVAGQRLTQPTFHERYEAMHPDTRAELLAGIVFLTPPHRADHGEMLLTLGYCLSTYRDDVETFLAVLRQGMDTPEHAEFAQSLARAKEDRTSP